MSHQDGSPPSDPPRPRELSGESGVDQDDDWFKGLDPHVGAVGDEVAGAGSSGPRAASSLDFDEIVRQHGRRLYLLAYRLTANRADAEDLSQEALVRGYMATDRFRGEADFYTYLYRALLNLWKNQIRSRRRWRMIPLGGGSRDREGEARDGEADPAQELRDRSPGPHERLVGREQSERLHRALLSLEPDFRVVLVLRVAEGLEYEEIAAALDIPVGTVRSRLARARGRIRDLLDR
jgi:RNA polymerase sigma-70 factor (ECF subfamily)